MNMALWRGREPGFNQMSKRRNDGLYFSEVSQGVGYSSISHLHLWHLADTRKTDILSLQMSSSELRALLMGPPVTGAASATIQFNTSASITPFPEEMCLTLSLSGLMRKLCFTSFLGDHLFRHKAAAKSLECTCLNRHILWRHLEELREIEHFAKF